MPYAIKGNRVIKKDTGKTVGKSKSPKKYLRTLQAVEHGWKPPKRATNDMATVKRRG